MNDPKRILFVCVENSNRSQMAEAFAHIYGGTAIEAMSAGSQPSGTLNPRAVRLMREVGYDLTSHSSKSLDAISGGFDAVITMGCGESCPGVPTNNYFDWPLPDPKMLDDEGYRAVRNDIAVRVREIVAALTGCHSAQQTIEALDYRPDTATLSSARSADSPASVRQNVIVSH